eukprot:scaffold688127_cov67-Attheya_sp.AAC.2
MNMILQSIPIIPLVATIGAATVTAIIFFVSHRRLDLLDSIFEKSAPVAAAEALDAAGSATCERLLDGRQLVITADAKVADYIFNGPANGNYVRRPAANEGLTQLGMLN